MKTVLALAPIRLAGGLLICLGWTLSFQALASGDDSDLQNGDIQEERFSLHAQFTDVTQWHDNFHARYSGPNSLTPGASRKTTNDITLFAGVRLWQGAELYVNPEIDQGFGLSNTLGVAGFPSGEAYKVGKTAPYWRWQRLFVRQTVDLGGETQTVSADANQLAGTKTANNLVVTAGKFSVVDIFDTNAYAHDPRGDFLNWAIVDAGAFDYAADAWGYSYGVAAEWTQAWWTIRAGLFDLSTTPNSPRLEKDFSQYALIGELEERHQWLGRDGKLKVLGFVNRGRMASYDDAVRLAHSTGGLPDAAQSRKFDSRPGMAINLEQSLSADLGAFARASYNDGSKEAFDFTEINRSLSGGLALQGNRWSRPKDTVGLAVAVNGLSSEARRYFDAGGLGILIGDGKLTHYRDEKILETYYAFNPNDHVGLSLDYQYIANPAYNADRGPVSLLGLRVHLEY
jgi:high affinity Mn2+ porin